LGELKLAFRSSCMGLPRKPTLIHREILRVADNYRSLDDVLQFANVTRPRVRLKQFQAPFVYPANVLSRFPPRVTIDQVLNQHRNIFPSFPQRRHFDGKNVEAVKRSLRNVPAAIAACKSRLVAAIIRTFVRIDPVPTDTFEFMFLQNTQQSDLGLGRKLSDFIEEDRASFSQLKAS